MSQEQEQQQAGYDFLPEEGEEEWEEDLDDMDEDEGEWEEEGLLDVEDSEAEEEEEDDDDDDDVAWVEDEEEDYLSPQQRARLECGMLEHDAHFFTSDEPRRHPHVASSTCHHQTADAVTFLPRPCLDTAAPGGGPGSSSGSSSMGEQGRRRSHAADGAVEEVVVSHRTWLSVWQLAPGQPAQLMSRTDTAFKHFSIAASPCGNFVAASGNNGLLRLFRVQRASTKHTAAQQIAPPAAAAAAGRAGSTAAGAALPWRLVHEATLLCATSRETMVNSVRFGSFGGQPRLLVAHQDGMLYLFNLPSSRQGKAAAGSSAAAAQQQPGSELMVRGLPDWEPLSSQIFRRFVEQIMAALEQQQQQHWRQQQPMEGQSASGEQGAGVHQRQHLHVQGDEAVAAVQRALQLRQQAAAMQQQMHAAAAAHSSRQAAHQCQRQQPQEPPVQLWMAGEMQPAMRERPASLAQAEAAIAAGERLLGFAVQQLAGSSKAAAELRPRFEFGSPQRQHCACSWAQRAQHVGQLLQDAEFLRGFERLQQLRLLFADPSLDFRMLATLKGYWPAVEALRLAAPGQQAMLGLLGPQQQQQQWQRQQQRSGSDDSGAAVPRDTDMGAALGRAAYLLLLLQLLAPYSVPVMKPSARVLLLKHGPAVDPSVRLVSADAVAAPRLATCAVSNVAICAAAAHAAAVAQAHAEQAAAAAAVDGAPPAVVAAAQIAAHDAQLAAAQQCLPLNICECSPDGRWLAVGVDQAVVLLVPAGAGYQHQACRVLDLCPLLPPRLTLHQEQGTLGCQYVAFNSSSSLLAATSDHLRMTSVFEVASGQLVATFSLHNRPLLPVRFVSASSNGKTEQQQQQQRDRGLEQGIATGGAMQLLPTPGSELGGSSGSWGDRLLVYCEKDGGLHIADLSTSKSGANGTAGGNRSFFLKTYIELPRPAAAAPSQPAAAAQQHGQQQQQQHQYEAEAMLNGAPNGGAAAAAEQRINGLAVTPAGRVIVACQADLMEWQLLAGWSRTTHARFPSRFKAVVGLLLLAAASSNATAGGVAAAAGSQGSGSSGASAQLFAQLPGAVLEQVIADAALPQGCWADANTPTLQQLEAALSTRPSPAPTPDFVHPLQLGLVLQQMLMPGGGDGGGPAGGGGGAGGGAGAPS